MQVYDGTDMPAQGYDNPLRESQQSQQTYGESVPDIMLLTHFCSMAHPPQDDSEQAWLDADQSWDGVRDWMRTHSAEEVQAAATQRDEAGKTALHTACQNAPPNGMSWK